jgi:peptide/nickel transport system substrate-binding protein
MKRQGFLVITFLVMAASLIAKNIVQSGSTNDPLSLDPARVWDDTSSFYIHNIYDNLVRLNPQTMKIEPFLASAWETSENGRLWTFTLRQGINFHDGTPFNAEAVVFTFFRQMDPANKNRQLDFPLFAEIFTHLQAVEKIDATTVRFRLSEPFSPFLATLITECAAIVSPTAVKKFGGNISEHPVGTGPFKLGKWFRGKRLTLEANDNYWRGRPAIDEFINIVEPRSETLINSFKEGNLDILFTYSISKMVSFSKLNWVKIMTSPSLSISFAAFNFQHAPLDRKGVRQAISLAWDPQLLKLVFQDFVLPIHTLLPKGMLGYASKEELQNNFSLERAKAILKKESLPNDLQLELVLPVEDTLIFQLFSLYAKNLKQIGIKLKIIRLPATEYERRIASGNYDLTFTGWIADFPDPDSIFSPLFSKQLQSQGFANLSGCGRKDIKAKLSQAQCESDQEKRGEIYRQISSAISIDSLAIPFFQDKKIIVYKQKIGHIPENPLGRLFLYDLKLK